MSTIKIISFSALVCPRHEFADLPAGPRHFSIAQGDQQILHDHEVIEIQMPDEAELTIQETGACVSLGSQEFDASELVELAEKEQLGFRILRDEI